MKLVLDKMFPGLVLISTEEWRLGFGGDWFSPTCSKPIPLACGTRNMCSSSPFMEDKPPFKIVGELDGIPIKRYAMTTRGLKTRRMLSRERLSRLPEKERQQVILNRLKRLSPRVWQAIISKRKAEEKQRQREALKAQRLSVLGSKETAQSESAKLRPQQPVVTPTLQTEQGSGERQN